jgi:hypothetical protein
VPYFVVVIASDRRERGNLFTFIGLCHCFGRFAPSQWHCLQGAEVISFVANDSAF